MLERRNPNANLMSPVGIGIFFFTKNKITDQRSLYIDFKIDERNFF